MVDEILVQNLEISFVTDYIVLIFSKSKENQFFEKNFGENLTSKITFLFLDKINVFKMNIVIFKTNFMK